MVSKTTTETTPATPATPATTKKPAKPRIRKPAKKVEGEILYPSIETVMYCKGHPAGPITFEVVKKLMGWQTEDSTKGSFGDDYLFVDVEGNKVRCLNNSKNRPFTLPTSEEYAQTTLCKQWAGPSGNGGSINGETIIISKYGNVLSGQHRLIGVGLAKQMWFKDNNRWGELWKTEPCIDSLVVFGVDEDPETVRTLDNVRKRTLADVLYTENLFATAKRAEKVEMTKMLEAAMKRIWSRAGMGDDAWSPYMTHGLAVDWITKHPRLAEAVATIQEISRGDSKLRDYLSKGFASAMLYLMGASATDGDVYHNKRKEMEASEKFVDFSMWEKAVKFWSLLGAVKVKPEMQKLVFASRPVEGDTADEYTGVVFGKEGGTTDQRIGTLIRAWERFKADKPIRDKDLTLFYHREFGEDGKLLSYNLLTFPTCGGIDLSKDSKEANEDEVEGEDPSTATEAEGIEQRIKAERERKEREEDSKWKDKDSEGEEEDTDEGEYDLEDVEPEPIVQGMTSKKKDKEVPAPTGPIDLNDPTMPFRKPVPRQKAPNNRLGGLGAVAPIGVTEAPTEEPEKPAEEPKTEEPVKPARKSRKKSS